MFSGMRRTMLILFLTFSAHSQTHVSQVYGDMFTNPGKKNAQGEKRGYFKLLTNTRCTKFALEPLATGHFQIGLA
jgi:hypothetical protein